LQANRKKKIRLTAQLLLMKVLQRDLVGWAVFFSLHMVRPKLGVVGWGGGEAAVFSTDSRGSPGNAFGFLRFTWNDAGFVRVCSGLL
jgi:hypothetical protein